MASIPVSLIVDDGGPVNMYHFHRLAQQHELLVPVAFTREFVRVCERNNIKGKFSVVPIPAGLGRIDGKVNQLPPRALRDFLTVARNGVMKRFSITPEILTHYLAYRMDNGGAQHINEDVYFSTLDAESIAAYVGLALEILNNVGLNPTGVTSPWMTGLDNERNYAEGIGKAFRRTLNRNHCFYFLHACDHVREVTVMCDSEATGRVVTIPTNVTDIFWNTQNPTPRRVAEAQVARNLHTLLSRDGRSGKLRELYEKGLPLTLITHWQSLFSDGRAIGLAGLEELAGRINRVFGKQVEWVTFEELADR